MSVNNWCLKGDYFNKMCTYLFILALHANHKNYV